MLTGYPVLPMQDEDHSCASDSSAPDPWIFVVPLIFCLLGILTGIVEYIGDVLISLSIEFTADGKRRTRIFYCDPQLKSISDLCC